jgi:hypothetical protein
VVSSVLQRFILVLWVGACAAKGEVGQGVAKLTGLLEHAQDEDLEDMRPEARALALAARDTAAPTLPGAVGAEPETIRVWRRKIDGSSSSCAGRVDVLPFEDYVKGVVPREWLTSWDDKALEMGAVCARTFAWWWIRAGGKYPCADIDDTAASQVYGDGRVAKTDLAVDRTRGVAIVKDGALVLAEYSAENGDPTAFGVDEPYCAGTTVDGHGRGTCQWGTQRWATREGRDFRWMVAHYYPGATVLEATEPEPTWLASLAAPPAPIELRAGADTTVPVDIVNAGTASWDGEVQLVTAAPLGRQSQFQAPAWLSSSAVSTVMAPPGATARVGIALRAPAVTAATSFSESFALARGDQGVGPDPLVTLELTVTPAPTTQREPPGTRGDAVGGCQVAPGASAIGAWFLAALFGLRWVRGARAGLRRCVRARRRRGHRTERV